MEVHGSCVVNLVVSLLPEVGFSGVVVEGCRGVPSEQPSELVAEGVVG